MWVAQHPCGTWCAYKEKPTEKLGGWAGHIYSKIERSLWLTNWRDTLEEMSFEDYQNKFRVREVI